MFPEERETQDRQLLLLDNVQFVYELALAQMELQSLGAQFAVADGLRTFRLLETKDEEELRKNWLTLKASLENPPITPGSSRKTGPVRSTSTSPTGFTPTRENSTPR